MSVTTHCLIFVAACVTLACGCQSDKSTSKLFDQSATSYEGLDRFSGPSLPIEQPAGIQPGISSSRFDAAPLDDFQFGQPGNYRMMSLEQCIYAALQSSPVIRELGGAILRSPNQVSTIQDPALVHSDPRFGEQAALSAFDANLNSQVIFQNNDRAFNNTFVGNNGFLQQNLASYRTGISKVAATGARFEFNHAIDYDQNNSPANRFNALGSNRSHAYDTFFEAGFRQPLLQGGGVDFNRIAGPNNAAGVNNGILIARTNTDIELAEFETQLRNLVSDVENAYWDLYFSYRDLESRIEARNGAYQIWRSNDAKLSDAAITNQAKEQYYRFAADVENAIHGRLNEGTRTNNGSSGGTFRNNSPGVRTAERRLRLITGMELNDSQLIVPQDLPTEASIVFDWEQVKSDAMTNRPELRRQRWQVKRSELELLASRNHLLPRVDLLGKYRMRGFGESLFGEQGFEPGPDVLPGSAATASLLDGDLQEWELGVDVSVPIGYRRQHAAVRNAELAIARESAILSEQERQVIYGLSNALGELKRSIRVRTANLNRLEAAEAQYKAIKVVYEEEDRTIDQLLDAQRRVIEAKTQFYQSQVEQMLAMRSVHFEKGTLFNYHNVTMSESAWSGEAYRQAAERAQWKRSKLNYFFPGIKVGENLSPASTPLVIGDTVEMQFSANKAANQGQVDLLEQFSGDLTDENGKDLSPLMAMSKIAEATDPSAEKANADVETKFEPDTFASKFQLSRFLQRKQENPVAELSSGLVDSLAAEEGKGSLPLPPTIKPTQMSGANASDSLHNVTSLGDQQVNDGALLTGPLTSSADVFSPAANQAANHRFGDVDNRLNLTFADTESRERGVPTAPVPNLVRSYMSDVPAMDEGNTNVGSGLRHSARRQVPLRVAGSASDIATSAPSTPVKMLSLPADPVGTGVTGKYTIPPAAELLSNAQPIQPQATPSQAPAVRISDQSTGAGASTRRVR